MNPLAVLLIARGVVKKRTLAVPLAMLQRARFRSRCCWPVIFKSAWNPLAVLPSALRIAQERIDSDGGVAAPVVLLMSALTPLAVLSCPWCC